ncbi:hypothetical protein HD554DRAFT_2061898 [Boletus coccyginus]|nr:hypothetical protein HD554DRAFT_2061898 [Boletus coccyginus]
MLFLSALGMPSRIVPVSLLMITRASHSLPTPNSFLIISQLPDSSDPCAIVERRYGRSNFLKPVRERGRARELEIIQAPWLPALVGCNHVCTTRSPAPDVKPTLAIAARCGTKIRAANPYQHSSELHTPCCSKLLDFVPSAEDEWQPMEGF